MTDRPTTAADKLRAWINGDRDFAWAQPNQWLDAALAEASQPDSEALERLLRSLINAPTTGQRLRDTKAAARSYLAALPPSASNSGGSVTNVPLGEFHDGIPQMAPPSAPPALDVERLAEAIAIAQFRGTDGEGDPRGYPTRLAGIVAVEYARLASQPENNFFDDPNLPGNDR